MLRALAIILGIVLAAVGGVIAYRAAFIDPSAAIVISNEGVRRLPNTFNLVGGLVLLILGAVMAFFSAVKRTRQ